jgi:uncharacterized membrane protein
MSGHYASKSVFIAAMIYFVIAVKKAHTRTYWVTVLEVLVMIGLGVFQLYYIKKILDNKRMI